ncbi:unnamed protein product [Heligmosomoides polygyrus]|uniref:Protein-tyrosine-phosphatase n=1 Tax=Heligmosomoides polygyrus TaxID=6339 RepID=A0A183FQ03_HELPZ|nr:unnamed protein product [Heligmosomoides polygyrus]
MDSRTHMEANAQEEQFRSAFWLLNTGDLDMEAPLPPVTFDAVRAANEHDMFGSTSSNHSALGEQGQRPKSVTSEHTASQVPLDTLITASKSGFDLDTDDEEFELDSRTHTYDAYGHQMLFNGVVRLTLTPEGGPEQRLVFLVKKGADDTIVLGTNILDKIGDQASPTAQQRPKSRTISTQTGERDKVGMFNTRAQVGLPDLARSKPVRNMFELANVASIALHLHWGDDRKEAELLSKELRYLTIHGLAAAIQAHSKFCYTMAMARRTQITSQAPDDMPENPIMIALPKHFGRVLTDVFKPAMKLLVYSNFGDLAYQLQQQCISSAFVWVRPNEVQSTQRMLLVQQAVERHLQCGGTVDLFPTSFELSREKKC